MSRTIPPLLEPYLALPPETALLVLTGVLGASTNWLVLRHLHALLKPRQQTTTTASEDSQPAEEETSLLLVSFLRDYPFWRDGSARLGLDLEALAKRGRFGFVDGLGGLFSASEGAQGGQRWPSLKSAEVGEVERVVGGAVDALRGGGRVVVVVDGMDFLVAAAGGGGEAWRGVVMGLREVCGLVSGL